jgi:DNA primase
MLQRKMEGGHATDDDKERLRWLVGEISRRRRLV